MREPQLTPLSREQLAFLALKWDLKLQKARARLCRHEKTAERRRMVPHSDSDAYYRRLGELFTVYQWTARQVTRIQERMKAEG